MLLSQCCVRRHQSINFTRVLSFAKRGGEGGRGGEVGRGGEGGAGRGGCTQVNRMLGEG